MRHRVGRLSWVDEGAHRSAVVEATDLLGRAGCDERFHRIESLEPRALDRVEVERLGEVESCKILFADPPASPEKLQEGQRSEPRVLAAGRPAQGSQPQHAPVEMKRVQDVVRIFHEVRKKIPSKLILIGDGPDRSSCEALARELGIFDDVKFLGKQNELVCLLSASDLFLIPSQSESFGLSALEAMACEVPVISSSVGGLPELVLHGQTGYIAEIGDIDRMARYAVELLTSDAKYKLFAAASRQRAITLFSADKVIDQYEAYYRRVLSESAVSVP